MGKIFLLSVLISAKNINQSHGRIAVRRVVPFALEKNLKEKGLD